MASKISVYSTNTNWVWLTVWKTEVNGSYDTYYFSLLRRMRPKDSREAINKRRVSPYGLISSVQYRDLLVLMYHAKFLLNFADKLVTEVEEFELQTLKHYDDLNAAYFSVLQRDFFDSGGISFPVFPICATREQLKRKYKLCLIKQTRKARLSPERESVPKSIDDLWREFNSFDFTGRGYHIHEGG